MVQIDYYQRGTNATINGDIRNCATTEEPAPLEKIVDITDTVQSAGLLFNEQEMRKLCEADDVWVSNVLMGQMNAVNVTLNQHLLGLQATINLVK